MFKFYKLIFFLTPTSLILAGDCALFRAFPKLQNQLAYKSLCDLPTPVTKLEKLENYLNHKQIYLKRDGLSGQIVDGVRQYGSNKVRKLEWLLADAIQQRAHTVMTYGCTGSNHALATAWYSKACGLKSILMLTPQPYGELVLQNLLTDLSLGAQVKYFLNRPARDLAAQAILTQDAGIYFIPTGGSNEIGTIGYVNAMLELCEQVVEQVLPMPSLIYVPIGSFGTVTGLLLGAALKKLDLKIVAVAIEPEPYPDYFRQQITSLFARTNQFLHAKNHDIGLVDFLGEQLIIINQFASHQYGQWMQQDYNTINVMANLENIKLEGTYSSKPFNAVINDASKRQGQTILLWETYCQN